MTTTLRAATTRPSSIRYTDDWNAEPIYPRRADHDRRVWEIVRWAEQHPHPLTADDLLRALGADL